LRRRKWCFGVGMAAEPIEISVDEAARLLRVQPQTVQRRRRRGELGKGGREGMVVLSPSSTWLRSEDAGAMLGLTAASVRGAAARGELAGKRDREGRWWIRLESVLTDNRCDPATVAVFTGERASGEAEVADRRPVVVDHLFRQVNVRLDRDESELLDELAAEHGSQRAAFGAALRALAAEGASPADVAELRVERDLYRDQAEEAQETARLLAELSRERLVDELYCPACDRLVPIEEADRQVDEHGTVVLYHRPHGRRDGGVLRSSSVMARRRAAGVDDDRGATDTSRS
jgi:hypothetical protein